MSKNKFYEPLPEGEYYCGLSLQNYTASEQCKDCHRNVYRLKDWSRLKRTACVEHTEEEFAKAERGDCPHHL